MPNVLSTAHLTACRRCPTRSLARRGADFIDNLLAAGRGNYTELQLRYGEDAPIADYKRPYAVLGGGPPGAGDKYASVAAGFATTYGFPTELVNRTGLDPYAFLDTGSSLPVGAIVGIVVGSLGERKLYPSLCADGWLARRCRACRPHQLAPRLLPLHGWDTGLLGVLQQCASAWRTRACSPPLTTAPSPASTVPPCRSGARRAGLPCAAPRQGLAAALPPRVASR